jgi:hypothetical protein
MLQQQKIIASQKYHLPAWQRMTLVTALLFSGGSLATLVPSQAVYAHNNRSHAHHHTKHEGSNAHTDPVKVLIVCKTGNGGKGGSATEKSSGATGGAGGNCIINVPIKVFLTIQQNKYHKPSVQS